MLDKIWDGFENAFQEAIGACSHGNYCGTSCRGNEYADTPWDDLDSACRNHDKCEGQGRVPARLPGSCLPAFRIRSLCQRTPAAHHQRSHDITGLDQAGDNACVACACHKRLREAADAVCLGLLPTPVWWHLCHGSACCRLQPTQHMLQSPWPQVGHRNDDSREANEAPSIAAGMTIRMTYDGCPAEADVPADCYQRAIELDYDHMGIAAAGGSTSASCSAAVYHNTDLTYGDLPDQPVDAGSWEDCCRLCTDNASCFAWTFGTRVDGSGYCFQKEGSGWTENVGVDGAVSGRWG